MQTVKIESGDSLYTIAHRVYGDETLWRSLGKELGVSVFDKLEVGKSFSIPSKNEILKIASTVIQDAIKKQYPELDLSKLNLKNSIDQISLIDWIL